MINVMRWSIPAVAVLVLGLVGCSRAPEHEQVAANTPASPAATPAATPSEDTVRAIARDAYIYGFPMVDNYRIQYSYFVDRNDKEYRGGWNEVHNTARVFTPKDTAIQTPNADTPYSSVGYDLRTEPLVFTVPKIDDDRYFSLQFIDQYTHNFAYIGSRATGNGGGDYLLVGPGWSGEAPDGIKDVIRSETQLGMVLYRTQLFGPSDLGKVRKIQAGYKVQPLSAYLGQTAPAPAPPIDFIKPLTRDEERDSLAFFEVLNFVLRFAPTVPSETGLMKRFGELGIGPDGTFSAAQLSPEQVQSIKEGIADAWKQQAALNRKLDTGEVTSGDLFGTRDYLKNDYLKRMLGATAGIYGNSRDEAMYPALVLDSSGHRLDGSNRYVVRFAPDQLPPVNAFWSITMYEMPASLLVENPINRYLINSPMLPSLKKDPDGGLTIYVQNESPGKERESNWLPAPKGPFLMAMRLYLPKPAALDGSWKAPQVEKVQ